MLKCAFCSVVFQMEVKNNPINSLNSSGGRHYATISKNLRLYSTNSVYLRTFARRKQSVGLSLVHYYIVKEESPGNAEHPTS